MFNPDVWSWAQWTALILMLLRFAITAALHGQDKKPEKWNGFVGLFGFGLWIFILTFGGFFA